MATLVGTGSPAGDVRLGDSDSESVRRLETRAAGASSPAWQPGFVQHCICSTRDLCPPMQPGRRHFGILRKSFSPGSHRASWRARPAESGGGRGPCIRPPFGGIGARGAPCLAELRRACAPRANADDKSFAGKRFRVSEICERGAPWRDAESAPLTPDAEVGGVAAWLPESIRVALAPRAAPGSIVANLTAGVFQYFWSRFQ